MTEEHHPLPQSVPEPDKQYTRCPNCGAIYLINPAKLLVRKGEVRCGECREVFNAISEEVERGADGVFLPKQSSTVGGEGDKDDGDVVADIIEADADADAGRHSDLMDNVDGDTDISEEKSNLERESSMVSLEAEAAADSQKVEDMAIDEDVDFLSEIDDDHPEEIDDIQDEEKSDFDTPSNVFPEKNFDAERTYSMRETPRFDRNAELPVEEGDSTDSSSFEPNLFEGTASSWERPALDANLPSPENAERHASKLFTEHEFSQDVSQAPVEEVKHPPQDIYGDKRQPPELQRSRRTEPLNEIKSSSINILGVDEYIVDRPNPLMGFFWFLVCAGFVMLLGLQVKYFFVEAYAQDDRYRPPLALFCKVANCQLPPRRDPYRFAITNTRIDLHPQEPGALRVTIMMINQAEFHQPYPQIRITLTDRVGRVVGRRTFGPEFYLSTRKDNVLKSGELGTLEFDLAHPHEKAVGFVVDVVTST